MVHPTPDVPQNANLGLLTFELGRGVSAAERDRGQHGGGPGRVPHRGSRHRLPFPSAPTSLEARGRRSRVQVNFWVLIWVNRPPWLYVTQAVVSVISLLETAIIMYITYKVPNSKLPPFWLAPPSSRMLKGNVIQLFISWELLLELLTSVPFVLTVPTTHSLGLYLVELVVSSAAVRAQHSPDIHPPLPQLLACQVPAPEHAGWPLGRVSESLIIAMRAAERLQSHDAQHLCHGATNPPPHHNSWLPPFYQVPHYTFPKGAHGWVCI